VYCSDIRVEEEIRSTKKHHPKSSTSSNGSKVQREKRSAALERDMELKWIFKEE
jgi:hypothetical protein